MIAKEDLFIGDIVIIEGNDVRRMKYKDPRVRIGPMPWHFEIEEHEESFVVGSTIKRGQDIDSEQLYYMNEQKTFSLQE